jgi:hypothetical protein
MKLLECGVGHWGSDNECRRVKGSRIFRSPNLHPVFGTSIPTFRIFETWILKFNAKEDKYKISRAYNPYNLYSYIFLFIS